MPTQEFIDSGTEKVGAGAALSLSWDFAYEHVYLTVSDRIFQIHNMAEVRETGVRIKSGSDEFFVYLVPARGGERFQVSVNERPLRPGQVDFASSISPDHPVIVAQSVSTGRLAPSKKRWAYQSRIEVARRWCRLYAVALAALTVYLLTQTPIVLVEKRHEAIIIFSAIGAVLIIVDVLGRSDVGARWTMWIAALTAIPLIVITIYAWSKLVGQRVFDTISPWTCAVPFVIALHTTLAMKCFRARAAGAVLRTEVPSAAQLRKARDKERKEALAAAAR
jgi:hypothetical protein